MDIKKCFPFKLLYKRVSILIHNVKKCPSNGIELNYSNFLSMLNIRFVLCYCESIEIFNILVKDWKQSIFIQFSSIFQSISKSFCIRIIISHCANSNGILTDKMLDIYGFLSAGKILNKNCMKNKNFFQFERK